MNHPAICPASPASCSPARPGALALSASRRHRDATLSAGRRDAKADPDPVGRCSVFSIPCQRGISTPPISAERHRARSHPKPARRGCRVPRVPPPAPGPTPVYRFSNTVTGAHSALADAIERMRAPATFRSSPTKARASTRTRPTPSTATPVPSLRKHAHADALLHGLQRRGDYVARTYAAFVYEGIAWYALPMPRPASPHAATRPPTRRGEFGPVGAEVDRVTKTAPPLDPGAARAAEPSATSDADFWHVSSTSGAAWASSAARRAARRCTPCAREPAACFKLRTRPVRERAEAPDKSASGSAWALSQIFVASGMKATLDLDDGLRAGALIHQTLAEEAFGTCARCSAG